MHIRNELHTIGNEVDRSSDVVLYLGIYTKSFVHTKVIYRLNYLCMHACMQLKCSYIIYINIISYISYVNSILMYLIYAG